MIIIITIIIIYDYYIFILIWCINIIYYDLFLLNYVLLYINTGSKGAQ